MIITIELCGIKWNITFEINIHHRSQSNQQHGLDEYVIIMMMMMMTSILANAKQQQQQHSQTKKKITYQ